MPRGSPWNGSHFLYRLKSSNETKDEVIRADTSAAKSSGYKGRLEMANFPASGQQGYYLPPAKASAQPAPSVSSPTQAANQRPS